MASSKSYWKCSRSLRSRFVPRPMYPIAMNITGTIVSERIITESIGWIASFGQAGSAVFPFMTGALAQKYSVTVLQPLVVGMTGALIVLWTLIPRPAQKKERRDLSKFKPSAST
ncbi:unnamed protein product [Rhizoctonia solani]|uniref:Major facilitator superfamily (MFS) profile domain-containing protein n=1 Tax=Rhizoctonia solani TaxID=456999 RepID=A0A8H2W8X6_9AGAM|nr:unnamed protein product [Rhizoctonia solani]